MMEQVLDGLAETLRAANLGMLVHWGDPMLNPQWDLPYVSVAPGHEEEAPWTMGAGGKNQLVITANTFVVVSAQSNFNSVELDSPTDRLLVQKVELVKAVLRENITLGERVLTYRSFAVQYRSGVRGGEGIRVAQMASVYEAGRTR